MRKTEQTPEPSIEEILASIRKIIADDGEPTAGPAFDPYNSDNAGNQASGADPVEPAADGPISKVTTVAKPILDNEPSDAPVAFSDAVDAERDDDILDLTDDCLLEELQSLHAPASAVAFEAAESEEAFAAAAAQEKNAAFSPYGPADAYDAEQVFAGGAKPDIPPLPSEQELAEFNDVISNVVAEMQRINDVNAPELEYDPEPEFGLTDDFMSSLYEPEAQPALTLAPEPEFEPEQKPLAQPAPSADFMPAMPEPKSASSASSAVHGATPPPPPAPPKAPVTPARKPAWSARNRTSAAKPKPTSDAEADSAKDAEANNAKNASPETASDASETPSPLMEAIATSLVTALADSNERQEKADSKAEANAEAEASAATPEVATTSESKQEPLPEEAFVPDPDDMELASSTAESAPAIAAPAEEAPVALQAADDEPPELPGEDIRSAAPPPPPASFKSSDAPQTSDAQPEPPVTSIVAASAASPASASSEASSAHMSAPQAALPTGLDESVQEMLKPMLAAWLDDNLPRLVEKALNEELAKRDLPKTEQE